MHLHQNILIVRFVSNLSNFKKKSNGIKFVKIKTCCLKLFIETNNEN